MSYLLDKKNQRKKFSYITYIVFAFLVLFYFKIGVWNLLSAVSHTIFRPVLFLGHKVSEGFSNIGANFSSKQNLAKENDILKLKLDQERTNVVNYNSLLAENISLKEIFGRKNTKTNFILGNILGKMNQSFYNTLIIDVGVKEGIKVGDTVFGLGNIPIGRIDIAYDHSAKVVLLWNSGEITQVVISSKDAFMEIIGRGGGNFEMVLPRDFSLQKGEQVVLPGINPYVVGIVETITSDPRDSFEKAILTSPINIQELKFVEVEI